MKIDKLKSRLERDRPIVSVTLRMPEDVIQDLKRIAPLLGFSGYQPLIRAYVGQGLRKDLERLDSDAISGLVAGLKKRGVSPRALGVRSCLLPFAREGISAFRRAIQISCRGQPRPTKTMPAPDRLIASM